MNSTHNNGHYEGIDLQIKRWLIVTGNVQEVGFRFFIKKLASMFKIKKGSVKNLDDENQVEIYCECGEKEYAGFIQTLNDLKIDPKKEFKPTDVTRIVIEDIQENNESSDGFNAKDIESPFKVYYYDDDDKDSERFERGCLTIQHMQGDMNEHFIHWQSRFDIFGRAVEGLDKKLETLDNLKVEFQSLSSNIGIIANFFKEHGDYFVRDKNKKEEES